jgi:hypothetical protein
LGRRRAGRPLYRTHLRAQVSDTVRFSIWSCLNSAMITGAYVHSPIIKDSIYRYNRRSLTNRRWLNVRAHLCCFQSQKAC